MALTIVPVVEGAGDVAALPGLLGRILRERFNRPDVIVAQGKSGVVITNGRQKLESKLENFLSPNPPMDRDGRREDSGRG